jgi:hypothetical protein
MTDEEKVIDWLKLLDTEIRIIILRINDKDFDSLFTRLRSIFDFPVPVTDVTSEVKNQIASLALSDGKMIARHAHLQNAVVHRLMGLHYRILQEA